MIVPLLLLEAGWLVVPEELGRTDSSPLQSGELIGRHEWEGCQEGEVYFHSTADDGRGLVICTGCRLHLDLPRGVRNYEELRLHIAKIRALRERR